MATDQTRSLFEDIVETIREPLLVLDSNLKVLLANQSFIDSFKVIQEETLGAFIYDLGNKQWDIPKLRELLETILPQKTSFDNYEVEHNFTTIGRRTMLLNARQIEQTMGKERIILLAIEDITERKQLETLLVDSEERYRRLFETASDGILLLEKSEFKIRHANPAITTIFGYSTEDCIGNQMRDIGFKFNLGTPQELLENLEKEGIIHFDDIPLIAKDGHIIDTDIYMVDKTNLIQCNFRDIAKRKRIEADRQLLFEAIEQADDSIVITNKYGIIKHVNPAFEQITGYSKQESIGRTPRLLESGHQDKSLYKDLWDTILSGSNWIGNLINKRKDGTQYVSKSSISPVRDLQNNLTNFIWIAKDITKEIALEKRMIQAEKMESVGILAGGIAHDFNNLLFVVMGNISLAQDDLNPEFGTSENLKEAKQACMKAKELSARLITFSKGGNPVKKMMSIDDLLKDTVVSALGGSNITLKISIADAVRNVNIDESQIKQVVRNIVVNAMEAMDDNGQFTVSCENIDIAEEGYLTLNQGQYIKISFKDQGCGISNKNLEKIFDPYFSTKDMGADKGQGLGLAVSYSIIQKHGGLITIEFETQTGSTFSIYLPALSVKEPDPQKS